MRRNTILLFVALSAVALLAGCGWGNSDQPTPSPEVAGQNEAGAENQPADGTADNSAEQPLEAGQAEAGGAEAPPETLAPVGVGSIALQGTVVLWHSWAQSDADALNEILGRIQSENPELVIETLFVAYADLEQSYIEAVQAGGGPDLVLAPNWWIGNLVGQQVVAPLSPLVAETALTTYWPATVQNLSWDDAPYGVPVNFELVSLFYNQSLVSADQLPASTEELLSVAAASGSDVGSTGIGLYNSFYHLYWGIPAYGSQLMDPVGKVTLDQGLGASEYLSWLIRMDELSSVYIDLDYGMLIDRFKKGEYAFFVDGPWSIGELRQALGDNLQVARLPSGPAGSARPWLSADGYFLNPNVPVTQQRLALATALELTNSQSGTLLAQISAKLPANQAAQIADPLLQGFMMQAESADPMPSLPEIYQVLGYGGDMLLKALNGVADPVETVLETTALINDATGR